MRASLTRERLAVIIVALLVLVLGRSEGFGLKA